MVCRLGFGQKKSRTESTSGIRSILQADLWEISIVTFPMLPQARVSQVKRLTPPPPSRLPTIRKFEHWLTQDAGLSRSEARVVINQGFATLAGQAGRCTDFQSGIDTASSTAVWLNPTKPQHHMREIFMTTNNQQAPEAKMNDIGSAAAQGLGGNPELAAAFDDFIHSFEQFKDANDDRLSQIERRTSADVITEEKVNRIDRAVDENKRHLDQLILKHRRPSLDGNPAFLPPTSWSINPGLMPICAQARNRVCGKSSRSHSPPDRIPMAVFWCPKNCRAKLAGVWPQFHQFVPCRRFGRYRPPPTKKPFATSGAETGWVGETDNRPETSTPTLAELQFQAMEIYAMPAATPRTA